MNEIRSSVLLRSLGASTLSLALIACGGNSTAPVTAQPTVAVLNGSYVFTVNGTDPTDGDYTVLGSFVADGKGNITGGIADYNLGSGIDDDVPLTGTYTVASGTVTVNLTDSGSVNDTFTAIATTTPAASITGFDGSGSGTLFKQVTSGFAPAGNYSFSVTGEGEGTISGSGGFVAGASGNFSSGTLTFTDAQTSNSYAMVTGFLGNLESGGRGLASLEGNNLAYYVIGPNNMLMIGLDDRALLNIPVTKQ